MIDYFAILLISTPLLYLLCLTVSKVWMIAVDFNTHGLDLWQDAKCYLIPFYWIKHRRK